MAEQRPFKPFVEGSIPSALTSNPPSGGFFVERPHKGMLFDPLCAALLKIPPQGDFFVVERLVRVIPNRFHISG
jgi:hypothetical protein